MPQVSKVKEILAASFVNMASGIGRAISQAS